MLVLLIDEVLVLRACNAHLFPLESVYRFLEVIHVVHIRFVTGMLT